MTSTPHPEPFHPDLAAARFLPLFSAGPRTLPLFRLSPRGMRTQPDVSIETISFAGPAGDMAYRVFRPAG